MKKLFLFVILYPLFVYGNEIQPTSSRIAEVTVYLEGATIERTGSVNLVPGENTVLLNDLSPDIDESSIQISGLKDASILSLNFNVDYLESKMVSEEFESLKKKLESLNLRRNELESRIVGYQEELSLLKQNKRINSDATDLSLERVKAMSEYYRNRMTEINQDLYQLQLKKEAINEDIGRHSTELQKLEDSKEKQRGEIKLKLKAKRAQNLVLNIKYNISTAGWFPIYDIKAKAVGNPIEFLYKANVYQRSGNDWKNIKINLSTGDPGTNNIKPDLPTKYLNFNAGPVYGYRPKRSTNYKYNPFVRSISGVVLDENGLPLPGTNIIAKGTSNGTQTDFSGRYTLMIPEGVEEIVYSYVGYHTEQLPVYAGTMNINMDVSNEVLEEVVVTGLGSGRSRPKRENRKAEGYAIAEAETTGTGATKSDGLTQMKFEIKEKYSIASNADITVIDIDRFLIPANFRHYVAPELNENVFLTATIKDWEKFDLLPGEANIYFEDAYAGKSIIDPGATADSLNISLGMDPNIIVKRERLDNFKSVSFLGGNRIVDQGYKIEVKNNKNVQVNLVIEDRIPISQNKEIKVTDIDTGDASYDQKLGLMRWRIALPPKGVMKKEFLYRVKFPKHRRVNL